VMTLFSAMNFFNSSIWIDKNVGVRFNFKNQIGWYAVGSRLTNIHIYRTCNKVISGLCYSLYLFPWPTLAPTRHFLKKQYRLFIKNTEPTFFRQSICLP